MRNILLGTLAGLVIGMLGAFAYNHFAGDGAELERVRAEAASASTGLTTTTQNNQKLTSEKEAMSEQIKQLASSNDELKKQVAELKKDSGGAAPAPNPMAGMAGLVKAQMAHRNEERLLLLKSRLHLTPEQEAAVKAAMDEETKRIEAATDKALQGGKIDMQAFKNMGQMKTVDQALDSVLTPEQKTAYDQYKTEEKKSQAETAATFEMNQVSPLLQLNESQKDQVYNALYQLHENPPKMDPANNPNPADPTAYFEIQAKAKEDALAKILTPEQLAIYHKQAQDQLQMQKAMVQRFLPSAAAAPAK